MNKNGSIMLFFSMIKIFWISNEYKPHFDDFTSCKYYAIKSKAQYVKTTGNIKT